MQYRLLRSGNVFPPEELPNTEPPMSAKAWAIRLEQELEIRKESLDGKWDGDITRRFNDPLMVMFDTEVYVQTETIRASDIQRSIGGIAYLHNLGQLSHLSDKTETWR